VLELKNQEELSIWKLYLFALKSPMTREKDQRRIEKFFDFLKLEGNTTEDKSIQFVKKAQLEGNQWVFNNILKFMMYQLDNHHANHNEIVSENLKLHPLIGYREPFYYSKDHPKVQNIHFQEVLF
jgi:hypothetical protein